MFKHGDLVLCKIEDVMAGSVVRGQIYFVESAHGGFVRLAHTGEHEWSVNRFELVSGDGLRYSPYLEAVTNV